MVRYLTALEWGMRWARPPVAERTPDAEVYVHHTAGGLMSPDAATAFRLLNEYAITAKGYSALDYDVLVHYHPPTDTLTLGEGRGPWMSAATLDRNEQGEAVCVMGYFHPGHKLSRQPFPEEVEGVALGIKWGIDMGWISRTASILGHRDNPAHPGATGCPGDYLYAKLPTIRGRVAELLNPAPPTPGDPVYFTLATQPATLWERIPGTRIAVRVDPSTFPTLGVDPDTIPELDPAEARTLTYLGGFPHMAVR